MKIKNVSKDGLTLNGVIFGSFSLAPGEYKVINKEDLSPDYLYFLGVFGEMVEVDYNFVEEKTKVPKVDKTTKLIKTMKKENLSGTRKKKKVLKKEKF